MKRIITLLFAILPLLGAAQTSSDLSKYNRVWVKSNMDDNRGIGQFIRAQYIRGRIDQRFDKAKRFRHGGDACAICGGGPDHPGTNMFAAIFFITVETVSGERPSCRREVCFVCRKRRINMKLYRF